MKERKQRFKSLSENQFRTLYSSSEVVSFEKGDTVIQEGAMARVIYMVVKGRLRVEKRLGKTNKVLGFMGPGDLFGELSFVSRKPRSVSVKVDDTASLIRVERDTLDKLDRDLQLFFYKRMTEVAGDRISQIEKRERMFEARDQALMRRAFALATDKARGVQESALIQEVVSKVPRLPMFAVSLAGKLMDDSISPHEVAQEVKKDPSLAAMILKTINSSYRGLGGQVSDIHHAVMLLGYNEVSQIIIAEGIRRALPDSELFRELYDHSLAISLLSFEISRLFNVAKPSEISTLSILHELGQIVIQLLKMKNPKLEPLFDLVDTSQMGTMLLRSWGLPPVICDTVEYQGYPEFAVPSKIPESVRTNVGVLYLSHLCYDAFQGRRDIDQPMIFYDQYLSLLNIGQSPLADLVGDQVLPAMVRKIATLPTSLIRILQEFVERNKMFSLYPFFNEL
ncbi:MAG: HDOD domain-containing protein [Desulfobacteraceae bacterium]|nr:HDOD domain-containing protein [Desulfobacteraceae bacterium]